MTLFSSLGYQQSIRSPFERNAPVVITLLDPLLDQVAPHRVVPVLAENNQVIGILLRTGAEIFEIETGDLVESA